MGNAPSSSRSHAHSSSSPTPQSSSSTSAGPVASSFASLTSRARARSKSSNVPLTAAQILASEPLIDGGHTLPLGLYQLAIWDFSRDVVRKLVQDRKMAPFYYGLEDWEEDWEEGEIVKGLREAAFAVDKKRQVLREAGEPTGEVDASTSSTSSKGASAANAPARLKEGPVSDVERRQAEWFTSSAAECPLCFLYYPANINTSRCCDQPICTECFVQIKRAEATATHLESEPACCPFCMEPNFGILYDRPRPKLTSINTSAQSTSSAIASAIGPSSSFGAQSTSPAAIEEGSGFDLPDVEAIEKRAEKKRRQSVGHTNKEVVTIDQIRPDWEAKLEAVKATVARRANRRIVMRQVGDRLIPIGITSSRDPIAPINIGNLGESDATGDGSPGRTRRRSRQQGGAGSAEVERLLANMGLGGADIEELMLMEAMRLSLLEHEQQQAREAAAANGTTPASTTTADGTTAASSSNGLTTDGTTSTTTASTATTTT